MIDYKAKIAAMGDKYQPKAVVYHFVGNNTGMARTVFRGNLRECEQYARNAEDANRLFVKVL